MEIVLLVLVLALGIGGLLVWRFTTRAKANVDASATGMDVEVDLVADGVPSASDTSCMRSEPHESVLVADDGRRYVFRHAFGFPFASIEIEASDFRYALVMGPHDSDDWERIAVWQKYSLRYKCKLRYD